jgi:histone deacetylase complex regulatory component SIN3
MLNHYQKGLIDIPGAIKRVSHLFSDADELLSGFNYWIPPGYEIGVCHDIERFMVWNSTSMGTEHEVTVSDDCLQTAKSTQGTLKRKLVPSTDESGSQDTQIWPHRKRSKKKAFQKHKKETEYAPVQVIWLQNSGIINVVLDNASSN